MTANPSQDLDVDSENFKTVDKTNETRKKNNKATKISRSQKKVDSNNNLGDEKTAELTHPSVPLAKSNSPSTQTRTEVVMLTDDKDPGVCRECIDLECDSEKDSRWSATPSVELSSDDLELTIVKETPATNYRSPITTPESFSKDEYSSPRTNRQFTMPPQHSLFQPSSALTFHACPSNATPEKGITSKANSIEPEADSSRSVNSYVWKRRKITGLSSVGHLHESNTPVQVPDRLSSLASSITTADATHRTEGMNHSENGCGKFKTSLSSTLNNSDGSHVPPGVKMDEKLQIFCSRCKNPLGLPESDLSVMCSRISTSKVHLLSLHKKSLETDALSTSSVDVLVTETSSLNHCLCGTAGEGASGQGVWCKEDGCVFNSIFCPFCVEPENCLGVHIVATDALNIKFQNKILLYVDCLEIKNFEASKDEALSSHHGLSMGKDVGLKAIEKFA
ncbi:hypothetical protein CDL12_16972 [Handroanthus impetiginosus]|uniref:Uncharacterized protein n=1 Tax=Handroanthus impetiginosus TaxID=429701 RepID=A0A2G9GYZ5_9LAMI|nr:hypothetical protein CDL12_16972 [Handroanthus impetiginosus]